MLSKLRGVVRPVQNGLAAPFVKANMSPSAVTLLAVPLSLASAGLCYLGFFKASLFLALLAFCMDFIDGAVARLSGRSSPFGNQLDAVVDRLVEGFILVGLAVYYPVLAALGLTFSTTISYIKARVGLVVISTNDDWPGLGDRSDRVALMLGALWALGYSTELVGSQLAPFFLVALLLVSGIGCCQRLLHAQKVIESAEKEGRLLPYLEPTTPSSPEG